MQTALTPISNADGEVSRQLVRLADFAKEADQYALDQTLPRYQDGKAANTLRTQRGHIAAFERFIKDAGITLTGFADDLSLWAGMTQGMLLAFRTWQLQREGASIKTINDRTSTLRTYCRLAFEAGYLPLEQWERVQLVRHITYMEGENIDEKRPKRRVGHKKEQTTPISPAQFGLLKRKLLDYDPRDTIACRDLLMLCLLGEHGLRCSEAAVLETAQIDYAEGAMHFKRVKTKKWQFHKLTLDTYFAVCRYRDALVGRAERTEKTEHVLDIKGRTINERVQKLGKQLLGIENLSPHDLRHYFATYAQGDLADITEAGGWASTDMAYKYRLKKVIANSKVVMPNQVCQ